MKPLFLISFLLSSAPIVFAESFTVYTYSSAESPDKYMYSCGKSDCTDLQLQAARLIHNHYGKGLTERLKDSPSYKYPTYWVYSESKCDFTIKAVERMPTVTSTMDWYEVNTCTGKVEKTCHLRSGCK